MKWIIAILAAAVVLDHINLRILKKNLAETEKNLHSLLSIVKEVMKKQATANEAVTRYLGSVQSYVEDLDKKLQEETDRKNDRGAVQKM